MATINVLFGGVQWSSSRVTFHRNTGRNIKLKRTNTVATNTESFNNALVFTSEPVVAGQMLKVTVTETHDFDWAGGMNIGFTGENPEDSMLTQCVRLLWLKEHKHLLCTNVNNLRYQNMELCKLNFNTHEFRVGDSLGIMMTLDKGFHWFLNGVWGGSFRVEDYPLNQPMWGVVDVYGPCRQVKAEISTVSKYNLDSERRLREMGLVQDARPQVAGTQSFFRGILGIGSTNPRNSVTKTVSTLHLENGQLQQQLTQSRSDNQQLRREVEEKGQENIHLQQQLTHANGQLIRANTENYQLIATLRGQIDVLQQRMASQSAANCFSNPQEVEFWQVSPEEVSIREDEILGRGA